MNRIKNFFQRWLQRGPGPAGCCVETPADSNGLESWIERFAVQKKVILSVSEDTEQEFASFGTEAVALFSQAETILAEVNTVVLAATDESAHQAVDLFEMLVADTETIIAKDQSEMECLIRDMSALWSGILTQVGTLSRHRSAIDDAVRLPLSLLKIGFRVEGACHQRDIAKILDAVGVEAYILGKKVVICTDAQFAALESVGRSMQKLILDLRGMSEEVRREHAETTGQILELKRHAEQLRGARQAQGQVAQQIETTGRELQLEFNRVVMAFQCHDITRQQLEHVVEAFESTLPAVSDSCGSATPALLHQTVKVQIHQTQSALGGLRSASKEFKQGMDQIARLANDLEKNISDYRNLSSVDEVFRALEGLALIHSMVAERARIKCGVGETACVIFEQVTDCSASINELTLDLRILAINAQVQAVNAEHHQVVERLAREMREVSDSIKISAEALTGDVQSIKKQLGEFAAEAWSFGSHQKHRDVPIDESVARCIDLLKGMQEKVSAGLSKSDSLQRDLQPRIANLLAKVHFPELAAQRLVTVIQFFLEVKEMTQPVGEHSESSMQALASMETNYTMASEREVHALVLANSAQAVETPAEIELFSEAPAAAVNPAESSESEFGDDIELF